MKLSGCGLHIITFRPKSAGATWHVRRKLRREVGGLPEEVEEGAQEVEANEISDKRPVEGDDPKEDETRVSLGKPAEDVKRKRMQKEQ